MIKLLSNNLFVALSFSALILSFYFLSYQEFTTTDFLELGLLYGMAVGLNYICRRFRIIGMKSHFTMVIFSLLSVLIFPILGVKALVVGIIWLLAVYYSFLSWEQPERSPYFLIYIGTLLGLAQILDPYSVLLFVPFFVLFYQNAVLNPRYYFLSLIYFSLVIGVYLSLLFFFDKWPQSMELIPLPKFDFGIFQISAISFLLPSFLLLLIVHLVSLRNYRFRYPNRSIKINYLFLEEMGLFV